MTKTLTFTKDQKAEARRWMHDNPWKELTDRIGDKHRWNPDECVHEWGGKNYDCWCPSGATYDYPYTYTEPQPEPKTLTMAEFDKVNNAWYLHPISGRPIHIGGVLIESYYALKAHVNAGHKLYASREDAKLALELGWS